MRYHNDDCVVDVNVLIGKVVKSITIENDVVTFFINDKESYDLCHKQDCCEFVELVDICGDVESLVGLPIVMAESVTNSEDEPNGEVEEYNGYTWTFHKFATLKGYVTFRWWGTGNGYYSETAYLYSMGEQE